LNCHKSLALQAIIALTLTMVAGNQCQPLAGVPPDAGQTSKYANKRYGITLKYPANYHLTEGELKDSVGLGYLGDIPVEFVAIGGVRVVTIEAPAGSYPGTDFVNSFFTINTNEYLTRDECEQLPDWVAGARTPIQTKISDIEFSGLLQGGAAMSHQYGAYYYHGFAEGTCYEVGYGIATAGYGAVDGMKEVDGDAVFATLKSILQSLNIRPRRNVLNSAGPPVIQSFSIADTSTPELPHTYRISWDVKGTKADQLSLSVSCYKNLMDYPFDLFLVAKGHTQGDPFPCDVLQPLRSTTGSLELEFQHMSGDEFKETVRLFAAGQQSVSRNLTISLPAMPVIWRVNRNLFPRNEALPTFEIQAGREVRIDGYGLLPKDVLWIGSMSLPIEVPDGKSFVFTAPTSLPEGLYPLFISNEYGKGNSIMVQLLRRRPQLAIDNRLPKILCNGGGVVIPGKEVRVEAFGLLRTNTVWIGATSVAAPWDEHQPRAFYLYFTAPASLAPGTYPFYITNELGKSDVLTVTVGAAQ
jgi:hypothetical protein